MCANYKGAKIKGGKMAARHILVGKHKKAHEVYDMLLDGQKFSNLAKQYSECSSRKKGGNLGQFHKGKVVSEFWDACANLQINEVSEPVKSQFGYHIIKRTK